MMGWFLAAMVAFFLEAVGLTAARATDVKAFEWGWMGVMFATLGAAGLAAAAGLAFALIAVVRRKERSLMLALPVLLGGFALYFGAGEALGHDEPGPRDATAGVNGHSNASAVEITPQEVRVRFDYTYGTDPPGKIISAITVSPLGLDGRPLPGYTPLVMPVTRGSRHADVVLEFLTGQLASVAGFSICFTGPDEPELGCARLDFRPQ